MIRHDPCRSPWAYWCTSPCHQEQSLVQATVFRGTASLDEAFVLTSVRLWYTTARRMRQAEGLALVLCTFFLWIQQQQLCCYLTQGFMTITEENNCLPGTCVTPGSYSRVCIWRRCSHGPRLSNLLRMKIRTWTLWAVFASDCRPRIWNFLQSHATTKACVHGQHKCSLRWMQSTRGAGYSTAILIFWRALANAGPRTELRQKSYLWHLLFLSRSCGAIAWYDSAFERRNGVHSLTVALASHVWPQSYPCQQTYLRHHKWTVSPFPILSSLCAGRKSDLPRPVQLTTGSCKTAGCQMQRFSLWTWCTMQGANKNHVQSWPMHSVFPCKVFPGLNWKPQQAFLKSYHHLPWGC